MMTKAKEAVLMSYSNQPRHTFCSTRTKTGMGLDQPTCASQHSAILVPSCGRAAAADTLCTIPYYVVVGTGAHV